MRSTANVLSAHRTHRLAEGRRSTRATRSVFALLPPLVALALHWALREHIQPYVWFLFFPAVFLSSWIGGLRLGLLSTVLCAGLVWWLFVPPRYVIMKDPWRWIPAGIFLATGAMFAVFHGRMKRTNEQLAKAIEERQIFAALVDNSPDFIGIADPDGNPVYVNPAGRRIVGLDADHPIASTRILEYYASEQRAFASDVILKTVLEQGHWHGETCFRNWQTQEPIPVSDAHFLIRDPDTGNVLGMGTITRDISEHKRLEQSLRETSSELARAQSVAEVGSWRLDVKRGELRWSDETYRLFGVPSDTPMTYEAFLACVHPEDRAHVDDRWRAALRGEPYDIEHRILADGAVRWVREKAELRFDGTGALLGGIGIAQNLTERKQLEEELRRSEALASGVVSIAADAIISIDESQRITMFNAGAERIFGYSQAEAIGAQLATLLPERTRASQQAHVAQFASGDQVSSHLGITSREVIGLRKNGQEFPADASISKLDVGGQRIQTVSLRDITEDKRAEAEHRFLAEAASVLSSTLDSQAIFASIAELAVRDLADYCVVDMVGEAGGIHRLKVAARDRANAWVCDALAGIRIDLRRPFLTSSALETPHSTLVPDLPPGGMSAFAQSDAHLVALEAMQARSLIVVPLVARGATLGMIGLVSSRSSRTYGERDVVMAEELARRAALSIENARLYAAARQAIQSRDDVMGVVAHDLRNPLNTIALQLAMLRRADGSKMQRSVEVIDRAAGRMNRLIQDLLDVTRMESGQLPLERDRVATGLLLSDLVDGQKLLAESASIELCLGATRDLPTIWADRDRVLQILENLIGNAIKFTPPGGRVTVAAAPGDSEVVFRVADTGAGIPPENQPHVFDRFWQGRDARRRGAGLGLPIVKGLVEAHGGRIWLESSPGHGCTFYFTLPANSRDEPPPSAADGAA